MTETPLVRLFAERKIRIRGDVVNPLLCAKDVANSIEDENYTRTIKTKVYRSSRYCVSAVIPGERLSARARFFTERGVYKYLLQSKKPKAEEFQEFVFDLLSSERKRVVDDQQLQAKIKDDEHRLRNEALQMEINNLSGMLQHYKLSQRTSDWLLTRSAADLEKGFKKEGATWCDLAVYYIKRFNREMDKKVLDKDPAELDLRLQRIAREAFEDPTMHYDGYAVFAKKAQELEAELQRGGKKDKAFANIEIDWVEYAKNLKLMQADSARQRAARARGQKPVLESIYGDPQA